MLSRELSFQLIISNVQEGLLPCCVQKKFAITLPSITLGSKKSFTVTLVNLRAQNFANNYLSENISLKQNVLNTYSGTVNGIDRDKTRFLLSAVRCHAGMSSKMGYDARLQDYDNEYRRLKLGKNVLNFFHVSHKISQERVDTPETDEFEVLMNVGNALLTEGEQGLDGRLEVGVASRMLKEAAVRFAAASAISPSSVAAANALGTTLLVHGKLKLTLSEKLRDMLLETRAPRQKRDSEETATTLENMIPKVCEECEKLLIEAGRNFGKAVSLDKSNDFALHSWGIALFHRARLIATDGLEVTYALLFSSLLLR
ncbi:hypothetical protein L7F22_060056 [Adiantum nelumboides]|nr:hypothetical protein [Adiantum nelumboides]